ncbi:hypothetical protein B7C42_07616 [Nocardia cerradoensis]|uniref:Uncharacterized protein n=1 Tax=Nocardia cerradoensis TaxID=85688 RepID=A0A231GUM8_9NOCA|nr:hypothetical protein B7C42_07616 [Nocardia cerradoensis]
MNRAAMMPSTSSWRTPLRPARVKIPCFCSQSSASFTAASWAAAMRSATGLGAIAHNADTLLTGEKVISKPATAADFGREIFATNPDNSRSSNGSRS